MKKSMEWKTLPVTDLKPAAYNPRNCWLPSLIKKASFDG